ncbi:hypothetical protein CROQUDRAFT_333454 [Cronartium quercuum f. sp. fusiforme G11]|uniref:Uncharacterized protein n=1 Tax=Cronartium quercuum f. sp. fusiforme G11 TaxID=708437 RepID=A0A9P6NAT4_9BASI|nr:hypothetical protein CROQUDRAFT_333454 [Cronartium quercuum f. sp. fusiforme G11]
MPSSQSSSSSSRSSVIFHPNGRTYQHEPPCTGRPGANWTILVVPPPLMRSGSSVLCASSSSATSATATPFSGSIILPLETTLFLQIKAIARSYSFPSISGISLHLKLSKAPVANASLDNSGLSIEEKTHLEEFVSARSNYNDLSQVSPRITKDSWGILFGKLLAGGSREQTASEGSMSTYLSDLTGFPIVACLKFEIDLFEANWYNAWTCAVYEVKKIGGYPASISKTTSTDSEPTSDTHSTTYSSRSSVMCEDFSRALVCGAATVSVSEKCSPVVTKRMIRRRSIHLLKQARQYRTRAPSLSQRSNVSDSRFRHRKESLQMCLNNVTSQIFQEKNSASISTINNAVADHEDRLNFDSAPHSPSENLQSCTDKIDLFNSRDLDQAVSKNDDLNISPEKKYALELNDTLVPSLHELCLNTSRFNCLEARSYTEPPNKSDSHDSTIAFQESTASSKSMAQFETWDRTESQKHNTISNLLVFYEGQSLSPDNSDHVKILKIGVAQTQVQRNSKQSQTSSEFEGDMISVLPNTLTAAFQSIDCQPNSVTSSSSEEDWFDAVDYYSSELNCDDPNKYSLDEVRPNSSFQPESESNSEEEWEAQDDIEKAELENFTEQNFKVQPYTIVHLAERIPIGPRQNAKLFTYASRSQSSLSFSSDVFEKERKVGVNENWSSKQRITKSTCTSSQLSEVKWNSCLRFGRIRARFGRSIGVLSWNGHL